MAIDTAPLADALAELEDRVRAEVERKLAASDSAAARQLDISRHAEDYCTWRRMGEAPAHVQVLAGQVAEHLPQTAPRDVLTCELVAMLERIYVELDSTGPE